ncbi:MAG: helix-turn-helix domain-containing protein [Myxococcota bacterium]
MPEREHDIGAFVREQRRAHGLTQRHLAELAGVGTRFLSELERGKSTVRLAEVSAVLGVFGKTVGVVDQPREPVAEWTE